jgi:hypothetical protein
MRANSEVFFLDQIVAQAYVVQAAPAEAVVKEADMMNFIESSAGRIAARIQSIGSSFDPEVLSLPGGSIIAIVLWLYAASMLVALNRAPPRPPRPVEPIVACSNCVEHD